MTRLALTLLALLAVAACDSSACTLEIIGAHGDEDGADENVLAAGGRIAFGACIGERALTCGGIWLVNGVDGGSPLFGTIDSCGVYLAPDVFPEKLVEIEITADFPGTETCIDCCTSASGTFAPR